MNTETMNRRQRVDAVQAALERAHGDLGAQKGKHMRMLADLAEQGHRVDACVDAVASAERALGEALAYQDPTQAEGRDVLFGDRAADAEALNGGASTQLVV